MANPNTVTAISAQDAALFVTLYSGQTAVTGIKFTSVYGNVTVEIVIGLEQTESVSVVEKRDGIAVRLIARTGGSTPDQLIAAVALNKKASGILPLITSLGVGAQLNAKISVAVPPVSLDSEMVMDIVGLKNATITYGGEAADITNLKSKSTEMADGTGIASAEVSGEVIYSDQDYMHFLLMKTRIATRSIQGQVSYSDEAGVGFTVQGRFSVMSFDASAPDAEGVIGANVSFKSNGDFSVTKA